MACASPKPLITTFAPCAARARAMARPMPLVDPVTRAVFDVRVMEPPEQRPNGVSGGRTETVRQDARVRDRHDGLPQGPREIDPPGAPAAEAGIGSAAPSRASAA